MYTKGGVTEDDIEQNCVAVAEGASRHIPEFVKGHEWKYAGSEANGI